MLDDSFLLLIGLLSAVIVLLVAVLLSVRTLVQQIDHAILGYRPLLTERGRSGRRRGGTRTGAPGEQDGDGEDDDPSDDELASPLTEVFRRYSRLTDRMADLIFRLTAQRSRMPSSRLDPGPEDAPDALPDAPRPPPPLSALPPDAGAGTQAEAALPTDDDTPGARAVARNEHR